MTRPAKLTPEERRARERDRTRRWRLANPEKRRAQQKRDRDNHREARRAAQRKRDAKAKGAGHQPPRNVRITPKPGPAIRDCAKTPKPEPVQPCESTEDFIARHSERVQRLPAPWTERTGPTPCRYAVRGRGSQG